MKKIFAVLFFFLCARAFGFSLYNGTSGQITVQMYDETTFATLFGPASYGAYANLTGIGDFAWRDAIIAVCSGRGLTTPQFWPIYLETGTNVFIEPGPQANTYALIVKQPTTDEVNFWIGFGVALVLFITVFYIKSARAGAQM